MWPTKVSFQPHAFFPLLFFSAAPSFNPRFFPFPSLLLFPAAASARLRPPPPPPPRPPAASARLPGLPPLPPPPPASPASRRLRRLRPAPLAAAMALPASGFGLIRFLSPRLHVQTTDITAAATWGVAAGSTAIYLVQEYRTYISVVPYHLN
ncbi:hypothetical protein GUJ93_ZPchr0003g17673 [Zizania palustris]|uniref:Uncharacterized protein n=1 Tax=Zizania palustris TaxID=103762 RepID=A0A8J5S9V0_ZIZPA|nr:hypothetical protein GUJ93_ZPchr0003g17673 [Zizania palustris]